MKLTFRVMVVVALFAGLGFNTAYSSELTIRNSLKSSFSITVNSAVDKESKQRKKSATKTIKPQLTQNFKIPQENKHIWVTMKNPALQWYFSLDNPMFGYKKDITIVRSDGVIKLSLNEVELIGVAPVKQSLAKQFSN